MSENKHAGHRERVKREFLENGFNEATPPHKILELLLFFSIPRRDTNEIAHELIDTFGSIEGVLDADEAELLKIKGITENSVALIKLILPIASIYRAQKAKPEKVFESANAVGNYLLEKYLSFKSETLSITSFNSKGEIISFDILNEGDSTAVELSTRKLLETVIKRNPACVILAHNHPGGNALPSLADIRLTEKCFDLLKSINVRLLDHIILSAGDYVSMAQSREFKHIFQL